MATANLGYQSFYQAQLTAGISATDLTIPLDVVPTPSEGFLVLESTVPSKREIIYYTSKTSNSVVCPAGGRGYDGTTASSHLQNASVIMAPVAAMFSSMRDLFETTPQGWTLVTQSVSSVAYNGNRSYTLTMSADVSATLSPGMRVRTTRTVTAPTQCTSLNGTTQYFNDTTVTGMTFTDDFCAGGWVKLKSYPAAGQAIVSRNNGTSGWILFILPSGQLRLSGYNNSLSNEKNVQSVQSIPLGKWVRVAAQLDMSAITGANTGIGATQNYIMFDGTDIPVTTTQAGTNPVTLIQAGNLEVGSYNGGTLPFDGKLAQVFVFSAKVTQATMRGYISQGLSGTETNLISAYSFNNSINDLNTTNANNLTANGSAVATNADSPFAVNSFGTATGTTDFGLIQSVATTTVVVQVPEGCTIPTSGGVSAMAYSTQASPYGFTVDKNRWAIDVLGRVGSERATPVSGTVYNQGNLAIVVPIGNFEIIGKAYVMGRITSAGAIQLQVGISTTTNSFPDSELLSISEINSVLTLASTLHMNKLLSLSSATTYYLNTSLTGASPTFLNFWGDRAQAIIRAVPAGI